MRAPSLQGNSNDELQLALTLSSHIFYQSETILYFADTFIKVTLAGVPWVSSHLHVERFLRVIDP